MTLTELKYIVAVARERHFGRAAEACYVSQHTLSVAVKKLEEELAAARSYLNSITHDHEAASEELQSANEEIISSNEELQSLNEELETSKEEIESTNEEAYELLKELGMPFKNAAKTNSN